MAGRRQEVSYFTNNVVNNAAQAMSLQFGLVEVKVVKEQSKQVTSLNNNPTFKG